jgi:hypothetical protein
VVLSADLFSVRAEAVKTSTYCPTILCDEYQVRNTVERIFAEVLPEFWIPQEFHGRGRRKHSIQQTSYLSRWKRKRCTNQPPQIT